MKSLTCLRSLSMVSYSKRNYQARFFRDLKQFDAIEMSNTHLVNNYSGIIPIVVKTAAGPFISNGTDVLFDNCAAYSSVTGGHNALPIMNAAIDFIKNGHAIHPSRAFYNQVLPQVAARYSTMAENILENPSLGKVQIIPANGGVEAVEGALKVARRYKFMNTGIADEDQITVTCKGNFHGRTIEVIAGNEDPIMFEGFATNQRQYAMADFNDCKSLEGIFETYG
ncbi:MAG: aminotransferase class III-fold pyridoxal phosphate-dependent enzyme, partial [Candidatus Margulisiibacteriota bacterium]